MSFDAIMDNRITIAKQTIPTSGQIKVTYTNVSTNTPSRIFPVSETRTQEIFGKFPAATHLMHLRSSFEIKAGYRVTDANGLTYEVQSVENFLLTHKEVILEEKKSNVT